jgi:predicted MFS family arabinose efflux permease
VVFFNFISYLGGAGVFGFLSVYLTSPKSAGGPGLSSSLTGIFFSVGVIVSSLLQGEYGKLADKFDKHKLIILSGLIGACGVFLFPLMNNLKGLIAAQILFVGGITLGLPAVRALVAIEGKELGTGTVMSVLQLSETAGHIIGSILSGITAGLIGLSNLFYLEGVIMILSVLLYYLARR